MNPFFNTGYNGYQTVVVNDNPFNNEVIIIQDYPQTYYNQGFYDPTIAVMNQNPYHHHHHHHHNHHGHYGQNQDYIMNSQYRQNNYANQQGYQNQGYGNQGYNNQGYGGNQGYGNQGYNNQGYNNQGYNNQGYNNQGNPNQGYHNHNYNQGYNNQGYNNMPNQQANQKMQNTQNQQQFNSQTNQQSKLGNQQLNQGQNQTTSNQQGYQANQQQGNLQYNNQNPNQPNLQSNPNQGVNQNQMQANLNRQQTLNQGQQAQRNFQGQGVYPNQMNNQNPSQNQLQGNQQYRGNNQGNQNLLQNNQLQGNNQQQQNSNFNVTTQQNQNPTVGNQQVNQSKIPVQQNKEQKINEDLIQLQQQVKSKSSSLHLTNNYVANNQNTNQHSQYLPPPPNILDLQRGSTQTFNEGFSAPIIQNPIQQPHIKSLFQSNKEYYIISSLDNSLVLQVSQQQKTKGKLIISKKQNKKSQKFKFKVVENTGRYLIISCAIVNVITANNNNDKEPLHLFNNRFDNGQQWDFKQISKDNPHEFFVRNCYQKYIDILEGNKEQGTPIVQTRYSGKQNQRWHVIEA